MHSANCTALEDRILWFDGDSTVSKDRLEQLLSLGVRLDGIFVDELDKDVEQYNSIVSTDEQIKIKTGLRSFNFDWNIPQFYKDLDVREYIIDRLHKECLTMSVEDTKKRCHRTAYELTLYEKNGLFDLLRVLIYVINTLQQHNIVWGVGRGSSVSSYVLYLIEVHDIDSIMYDLEIFDFLRPPHSEQEK